MDSEIHAEDSGFQVLDSRIFQWNLNAGFQSLVGFRIPWDVFRIPNPRIPDSISKNFHDFLLSIMEAEDDYVEVPILLQKMANSASSTQCTNNR